MDNPKTYLLKKIIGHESNGLSSFWQLHAKHVDDIAKVMKDFSMEMLNEVIDRLNKGESVNTGDGIITLNILKRKKMATNKN